MEVSGKTLKAQFTDLADQTNGSVILSCGNTVILATAVMSKHVKEGSDFFPLTVDYEEKFYASGQILGSRFVRREGRPSDEAILSGRIVDRTIRPLFDQYIRNEVQVVITVLSIDQDDPDILGVIGASLALGTSNIPWNGPVSAVRVNRDKETGEKIINPNYEFRNSGKGDVDVVACGKDGNINMIEVGAQELSETIVMDMLTKASEEIEKIQAWQKRIIAEIGKQKKVIAKPELPAGATELFAKAIEPKLLDAVFTHGPGHVGIEAIEDEWAEVFAKEFPEGNAPLAAAYCEEKINDIIHREAIENNRRPDGRGMDEVRPLFAKAGGVSPIIHGTGIFFRGGTHILSALTLGGPGDAQTMDGMEKKEDKRFMHHYNFPPFSTGETGRSGGTNRRMIGHGALAEKALVAVIPPKEIFPYTIRIVSEALASNGSTSMGSVCGSTLALMDGGVPIKAPVAGIASGLMMETPTKYKVLTDIQGPEDHHGDMDFKVAGTTTGITAVQMDVKVGGIPLHILAEAFEKAKAARIHILGVLTKEISKPRDTISPNAPQIISIKIKPDQIGMVIGSGGKTIKEIKERTGAEIDIEDDGTVFITGKNGSAEATKKIIEDMTHIFQRGEVIEGTVVRLADFGAFVSLNNSTDGLLHVSEIAPWRVERVADLLKVGQKIKVLVKDVEPESGKIKLSTKDLDPNMFPKPANLPPRPSFGSSRPPFQKPQGPNTPPPTTPTV